MASFYLLVMLFHLHSGQIISLNPDNTWNDDLQFIDDYLPDYSNSSIYDNGWLVANGGNVPINIMTNTHLIEAESNANNVPVIGLETVHLKTELTVGHFCHGPYQRQMKNESGGRRGDFVYCRRNFHCNEPPETLNIEWVILYCRNAGAGYEFNHRVRVDDTLQLPIDTPKGANLPSKNVTIFTPSPTMTLLPCSANYGLRTARFEYPVNYANNEFFVSFRAEMGSDSYWFMLCNISITCSGSRTTKYPLPTKIYPLPTKYPTISIITTAMPTSNAPTTAIPTTSFPTSSFPTTAMPTSSAPTTAIPTTNTPTTTMPTTAAPITNVPTTVFPTLYPSKYPNMDIHSTLETADYEVIITLDNANELTAVELDQIIGDIVNLEDVNSAEIVSVTDDEIIIAVSSNGVLDTDVIKDVLDDSYADIEVEVIPKDELDDGPNNSANNSNQQVILIVCIVVSVIVIFIVLFIIGCKTSDYLQSREKTIMMLQNSNAPRLTTEVVNSDSVNTDTDNINHTDIINVLNTNFELEQKTKVTEMTANEPEGTIVSEEFEYSEGNQVIDADVGQCIITAGQDTNIVNKLDDDEFIVSDDDETLR